MVEEKNSEVPEKKKRLPAVIREEKAENKAYWDVPVPPEMEKQLEMDLFQELNERYEEDDEVNDLRKQKEQSARFVRTVGLATGLIFLFLVLLGSTYGLRLPPLDFLTRSQELAQDTEIQALQQAVVHVEALGRRGTGFNISSDGLIVTNHHVIADARVIYVNFSRGGQVYRVQEQKSFPEIDLALLKIEGANLPALPVDERAQVHVGEQLLIIGNPLGFSKVVKEGEYVGLTRLRNWNEPVWMIESTIYQGSSGSPVLNEAGEVVAVIFATLRQESDDDSIIGLAVPVNYLQQTLRP
ncbi:trypsin-like peptidase domain-containing protein [Heliorestis acidaminivorans]|uniref:Trypsin-like peptidase domain-containing protein n=1 Tax=Heliorestis acidaminivorans TaxID=553427 RepID=A0A6I0ETN5_9FIRM|nr:serine protease [Heliorestis acidaminivorans]KAB2952520.1 trypsin-like peptidase domain-containing protein [Heliorestis acidaminivorans]